MPTKIIVEVRGGVVQEVYCDDPTVNVLLVDWDNDESGKTEEFPTVPTAQFEAS